MRFFTSIVIACLLSSCASVNGVFMKRKYTKGRYFDLAHRKQEPRSEMRVEPTLESVEKIAIAPSAEVQPQNKSYSSVAQPKMATDPISFGKELPKDPVGSNLIIPKAASASSSENNIHKKLEQQLKRTSDVAAAAKLTLYIILFFVLTIIYTFAILVKSPGFPLGLAIVVAMLGALLTLLTGQLFI